MGGLVLMRRLHCPFDGPALHSASVGARLACSDQLVKWRFSCFFFFLSRLRQRGMVGLLCLLLSPFENISCFNFSRFILFVMHLDIIYVQIHNKMYKFKKIKTIYILERREKHKQSANIYIHVAAGSQNETTQHMALAHTCGLSACKSTCGSNHNL